RPQGDHRSARRAQGRAARSLARRRSRARQQGFPREQRGEASHGPAGVGVELRARCHESRMIIVPGDFENAQLLALLRLHLAGMHTNSPPGSVNAFDLSGLKTPDISVYTAWRDGTLLGMAALKQLDAVTGEIKSMRTDPAHLREGVAKALLDHILSVANER